MLRTNTQQHKRKQKKLSNKYLLYKHKWMGPITFDEGVFL